MKKFDIHFVVPGKPQGKGRPRFHNGRVLTPKNTMDYEKTVQQMFTYSAQPTLEGAISVKIMVYYKIPKNTSKSNYTKMINGEIRPKVKPDLDNIAKVILDSLNGLAYKDDNQVVRLSISKFYDTSPRVSVMMMAIDG